MKREYRVLSALHSAYPLAPRGLLFCEDTDVIGAPFVIVERRFGFVIRRELPRSFIGSTELNLRISNMVIDNLAALHKVNYQAFGLESLGVPVGYVARQMDGWAKRWNAAAATSDRSIEHIVKWLTARLPRSYRASLLHNDYKLDNILVNSSDPGQAVAVLDWDMATLGDPLMDLGYVLNYWAEAGDDPEWIAAAAMPTWYPGFSSRRDVIDRYAQQTGFDLTDLHWFRVFAVFKVIVILQQIYVRYLRGQTKDERFAGFGARIARLTSKAESLASE